MVTTLRIGLALLGEDKQKASISLAVCLKKTDNLWRNLFSSFFDVFRQFLDGFLDLVEVWYLAHGVDHCAMHQLDGDGCAEPFGRDAEHMPAHSFGGVVLFHVGLEAPATGVAALGIGAAFDLDGHLGGGDGVVEAPLAGGVEHELTHALVARCLFDEAGEVSLDFVHSQYNFLILKSYSNALHTS